MTKVATIILNRNLPEPTDKLYEHLVSHDAGATDLYVLEAGSDKHKLSKYCSWHADTDEIRQWGLRYSRGMNFALLKLWEEGKWDQYDAFFLLTNDTELASSPTLIPLLNTLEEHPSVGILSPCSVKWGERLLLHTQQTKFFWFIHNNAFLLRRTFLEKIIEKDEPSHMNFVFDGSNFRGYLSESELIAKAYANDWAAAITSKVYAEENESYLLTNSDLIRTETYEENIRLYLREGEQWLRRKYGFNSRWSMQQYVKCFYDKFFEFHPEYAQYRI